MNNTESITKTLKKFGYTELYEFNEIPKEKIGKFVGFSNESPDKISLYNKDLNCKEVLGVTTINALSVSNNYDEWNKKYLGNEFGDNYVKSKVIAVGKKQYDEINERYYMATYKSTKFDTVINPEFDSTKKYINRLGRPEWVKVALIGQVIVIDNGKCKPGEYCIPYNGADEALFGTAIPAKKNSVNKYYILNRFSDSTITILLR